MDKQICPQCGEENLAERAYCWKCYSAFKSETPISRPPKQPVPLDAQQAAIQQIKRENKERKALSFWEKALPFILIPYGIYCMLTQRACVSTSRRPTQAVNTDYYLLGFDAVLAGILLVLAAFMPYFIKKEHKGYSFIYALTIIVLLVYLIIKACIVWF